MMMEKPLQLKAVSTQQYTAYIISEGGQFF